MVSFVEKPNTNYNYSFKLYLSWLLGSIKQEQSSSHCKQYDIQNECDQNC